MERLKDNHMGKTIIVMVTTITITMLMMLLQEGKTITTTEEEEGGGGLPPPLLHTINHADKGLVMTTGDGNNTNHSTSRRRALWVADDSNGSEVGPGGLHDTHTHSAKRTKTLHGNGTTNAGTLNRYNTTNSLVNGSSRDRGNSNSPINEHDDADVVDPDASSSSSSSSSSSNTMNENPQQQRRIQQLEEQLSRLHREIAVVIRKSDRRFEEERRLRKQWNEERKKLMDEREENLREIERTREAMSQTVANQQAVKERNAFKAVVDQLSDCKPMLMRLLQAADAATMGGRSGDALFGYNESMASGDDMIVVDAFTDSTTSAGNGLSGAGADDEAYSGAANGSGGASGGGSSSEGGAGDGLMLIAQPSFGSPTGRTTKELVDAPFCVCCQANTATVAMLYCGHICLCVEHAEIMEGGQRQIKQCPLCKAECNGIVRLQGLENKTHLRRRRRPQNL